MASQDTAHVLVVGSGPTGIIAARYLVDRGVKVTILDQGSKPSESTRLLTDRLSTKSLNRDELQSALSAGHGFSRKSYFGDFFPYEDALPGSVSSLIAKSVGGFSKVWGGTFFPAPNAFIQGLSSEEKIRFRMHEEYICSLVGHRFVSSNLDEVYPKSVLQEYLPTTSDLTSRSLNPHSKTVLVGPSRLAIGTTSSPTCFECGLCHHGCPWGLIWSSDQMLPYLNRKPNFEYLIGKVEKFEQVENGLVEVNYSDAAGVLQNISGNHLLLAAGPVGSARIVLNSGLAKKLTIADSKTLFCLMVSPRPIKSRESRVTLSEAVSVRESNQRVRSVIQMYSWSDYLEGRAMSLLGKRRALRVLLRRVLKFLGPRLVIGICYLEDIASEELVMSAERATVTLRTNKRKHRLLKTMIEPLRHFRNLSAIGLIPIPFANQILPAGMGHHSGSTRCLNRDGEEIPINLVMPSNVRCIDSSAMHGVPAGSVTLPAMANGLLVAEDLLKL